MIKITKFIIAKIIFWCSVFCRLALHSIVVCYFISIFSSWFNFVTKYLALCLRVYGLKSSRTGDKSKQRRQVICVISHLKNLEKASRESDQLCDRQTLKQASKIKKKERRRKHKNVCSLIEKFLCLSLTFLFFR